MKPTKRKHRSILLEAILWAIAEIILSSAGLDTLADYSEFLVNQKAPIEIVRSVTIGG
ncbi:MAG: hypothetical protein HC827_11335 [Cyanobacteria bacterium RM1_2_2]|nr:hypothetical protein [Cyanobacteria bacterium RM1_2_2]